MAARIPLLLAAFLFTACSLFSSKGKVIFVPDPAFSNQREQPGLSSSWQIIESQNGHGENGLPAWVRSYCNRGVSAVETMDAYRGKYVFIGRNRGENFNALRQWADNFTVAQDLPRLIVQRVERRLVSSSSLYPDDEYGEYYVYLIKKVSDEEYPEAVKEDIFWTKQRKIPGEAGTETAEDAVVENHEFLILVTVDRGAFQSHIQDIMANIKTAVAPTREQTTVINNIRQTFFEGF